MIRSAMAAMIVAALAAAPGYAQGQPETPDDPYQERDRPPAGEIIRDVIRDALNAAAEAERRRHERYDEGVYQPQPIPPPQHSEPVAVAPPVPEPSSQPDPELNHEPVPAGLAIPPAPTRPAARTPAAPHVAPPPTQPTATVPHVPEPPSSVDPGPTAVAIGTPTPALPEVKPPTPPPQPKTKTCPDDSVVAITATCPPERPPLNRWWPLALLGFGAAAAGGGWSVQQRRARLARTRAALSLEPRLDQQAGTSSASPIKLAAPRVSIRTRLEYS